jgi:hypothetical protein
MISQQEQLPEEPFDFSPPLIRVVFEEFETTPEFAEFKSSAPPEYACMHVWILSMHVCMYACMYACMDTTREKSAPPVHACMYACMDVSTETTPEYAELKSGAPPAYVSMYVWILTMEFTEF